MGTPQRSPTLRVATPMPGTILIPAGPFRFCLRVDRTTVAEPGASYRPHAFPYWGWVWAQCTRLDWDPATREVGGHPSMAIVTIRRVARGVWREWDWQGCGGTRLPMYFREREMGLFS